MALVKKTQLDKTEIVGEFKNTFNADTLLG
jgi:hypothetical protein